MYRTGDLARYLPDGTIELLGRTDKQVKLRGYRVEPGEIEAVLRQLPLVREATILVHQFSPGEPQLIAYVVLHQDQIATISELRNFLKLKLPDHMVPSGFVMLEQFPLNSNGKLDISKLPTPDRARFLVTENHVAPRSAVEMVMAGICGEVLGLEELGVLDNFFELGGHSLLAVKVVSRIRECFQVELPVRTLFLAPTVEGMAAEICRKSGDAEKSAQMVLQVTAMDEEQLDAVLEEQSHSREPNR